VKKEEINLLAHLLTGMKESVERLEKSQKKNDREEILASKKEILYIQRQLEKLL